MDMPGMNMPALPVFNCRVVSEVLSRLGDKWTVQVVVVLWHGPRRFNEIKRQVTGISQQMLTRTLKTLERDGMVERRVTPTTPPQVEYRLTPMGESLAQPVRGLADWARENLASITEHRARYDAARA